MAGLSLAAQQAALAIAVNLISVGNVSSILRLEPYQTQPRWSFRRSDSVRRDHLIRISCARCPSVFLSPLQEARRCELTAFRPGAPILMPTLVPPSDYIIRKALGDFSIEINQKQLGQIQEYIKLLLAWNEKINLTAIRDPLDMLYRHFCESMYAARVGQLDNCRLADIGTGGGFPGLPLKILAPDTEMFLIESNVKKATFVAGVIRTLGFTGARVVVGR